MDDPEDVISTVSGQHCQHECQGEGRRKLLISTSSYAGCQEDTGPNDSLVDDKVLSSERVTVIGYVSPVTLTINQQPISRSSGDINIQVASCTSESSSLVNASGLGDTFEPSLPPYEYAQTKASTTPSSVATRMTKFISPSRKAIKPLKDRKRCSNHLLLLSTLICSGVSAFFIALCIVLVLAKFAL
jgi:hypothetical protein